MFELVFFAFVGNRQRGAFYTRIGHYHDNCLIAGYAAMASAHRLSECLPGAHLMPCSR
ncbi:hypothetical protein D3C85_1550880 [compost metagenome]